MQLANRIGATSSLNVGAALACAPTDAGHRHALASTNNAIFLMPSSVIEQRSAPVVTPPETAPSIGDDVEKIKGFPVSIFGTSSLDHNGPAFRDPRNCW